MLAYFVLSPYLKCISFNSEHKRSNIRTPPVFAAQVLNKLIEYDYSSRSGKLLC